MVASFLFLVLLVVTGAVALAAAETGDCFYPEPVLFTLRVAGIAAIFSGLVSIGFLLWEVTHGC
jgi:hypothetical protein